MRKLQKVAVVAALLGSVSFAGAGSASAWDGGDHYNVQQSTSCKSHDLNLDILGEVGILNGLAGNALNGEGNPGAQETGLGSHLGCNNSAFGG
ncbi:hypothetical protein [Streptacidiphilus sp. P02-A3a]|uniref:hypothetical protein n=1 Tax=Streptacidiphilus sp. P02-A3a TaxID=2704468 RepID=UPI0015FD9C94|nr:hypothetical protein [Streptacidiphilus sp. P02-A3a]QMU70198.1 hypothetical protein GXP74_20200 [Streptacidiphilus sp. P02-A3a]QMU70350.1 hypothetical protein GXP74_21195 [Streptacidiphilus sp. P02-A3a]